MDCAVVSVSVCGLAGEEESVFQRPGQLGLRVDSAYRNLAVSARGKWVLLPVVRVKVFQ